MSVSSWVKRSTAKAYAKSLYNSIIPAAIALRHKYHDLKPGVEAASAVLDKRTDLVRNPHNPAFYHHVKQGWSIELKPDDTLYDVVVRMATTEVSYLYHDRPAEKDEYLQMVLIELDKLHKRDLGAAGLAE